MVNTSIESYQDDVLLKAVNFPDALSSLRQAFERIGESVLKLRLEKCKFMLTNVKYLGFHVTSAKLIPPKDKMDAIRNVLPLNSLKELQQFLGLANQYRSFIPNYAQIAGPLYELQSQSSSPPSCLHPAGTPPISLPLKSSRATNL